MATGDRLPIAFSIDLAPEYSTTSSYSAGQCCTRNGILYVCINNNVHGTWNPDAWQAVTVMDQVYSKDRYLSNVDDLNKLLFLECLKNSAKNTVAITVESSTTASVAHPTGSYFLMEFVEGVYDQRYDPPGSMNDGRTYALYRAISDIAQGNTIVTDGAGQNCVAVTIGDELSKTFSNTAPAFDSTENYAVGAYTIYNGILCRCTTAHTGAWDASHFEAVSVGDDIVNYLPTLFAPAGFGLGGTPVRLRGGDLNTVETCGFYYWANTDGVTNAPYTDTSFCFNAGGCQIVIPRGSNLGKIAFRTKSSTWGAWYELTGTLKS